MVVYVQSLVKCFLRFGTYGLQLLNDLIKRNYLEHFFIKTITLTTIYNQKSKFLENLYTHHLFVTFFMKNNQSLFLSVWTTVQYCTAVAHTAIPFFSWQY